MKNRTNRILLLITGLFAAFALGFLLGRTTASGDVVISQISEVTESTQPVVQKELSLQESATEPTVQPVRTSVTEPTAPESQAPTESSESTQDSKININTATLTQLDTLPGIGPVLAQRIIDYREQYGPFTNVAQLINVSGIGEKRLAEIIDLITV